MSKTPFSKKCQILGELWLLYRDEARQHEAWRDYFAWADVALPMAYFAWQDMVTVKPESKSYIDEAWDVFCEIISIDPNEHYVDLGAAFATSPNEPVS